MSKTKGIILAGGKGTRLYPLTQVFSKQLQPIYDKPMIYYPLSTLMLGGIRDILIISTPQDTPNYERLLGDGSQWGISLTYVAQQAPRGLPEAFIYGRDFIGSDQVCLILGDNLFYGKLDFFREGLANNNGGTIFAYPVKDPRAYGVAEFDRNGNVLSLEEKPKKPKSKFAIPGLYVFDSRAPEIASELKPSARGELEIVDMHKFYLNENNLRAEKIGRGVAWLDTGSPENLLDAGAFIEAIEKRQGMKIACLEEISLAMNFVDLEKYLKTVEQMPNCGYKNYCLEVAEEYK